MFTTYADPIDYTAITPWGAARELAVAVEHGLTEVEDVTDVVDLLEAAWVDARELVGFEFLPEALTDPEALLVSVDSIDARMREVETYYSDSTFGGPWDRALLWEEAHAAWVQDLIDAWHVRVHAAARFPWPAAPWQQAI